MTTEIAVLNRLGIALAADSAVTISGGGTTKVFESADKLFELSSIHPVGLMLNGNMDCFGVPWEIIIKDFREIHGSDIHRPIEQWAKDFIRFVESRPDVGNDHATNYIRVVTESEISRIKTEVPNRILRVKGGSKQTAQDIILPLILEIANDRNNELVQYPISGSVSDITIEELIKEYREFISEIIDLQFKPFDIEPDIEMEIILLIVRALRASIPSEFSTGLVIAGYGLNENYPAVSSIEIDGYLKGKLKYSGISSKAKIDRPELGYAVSFAQTDVIERVLSGVHPSFILKTSEFLSQAATTLANEIVGALLPRASQKRRKSEAAKIDEILRLIGENYVDVTAPSLCSEFREEFERMIALMPKMELIELAEALISITAIERKATSDEGTVGGPIDVAFITKHEGFVWIKRKHYFEPGLNPRYFWRKYQQSKKGVNQ
jgi:hypothetical protein